MIGLDWRKKADKKVLAQLNFDIAMTAIELIKEISPNIGNEISSIDFAKISIPSPSSLILEEIKLAKKADESGNFNAAKGLLEKALSKCDGQDPYVFTELAELFDKHGHKDEALKNYLRALELIDDFKICINCAILYSEKNEYEKALEYFNLAEKINPFSPSLYYNRCMFFYQYKKYSECLSDINKLIEIEPQNSENFLLHANLLLDQRKQILNLDDIKDISFINRDELVKKGEDLLSQAFDNFDKAYNMGLKSHEMYFSLLKFNYDYAQDCCTLIQGGNIKYLDNLNEAFLKMQNCLKLMISVDNENSENNSARSLIKEIEDKQSIFLPKADIAKSIESPKDAEIFKKDSKPDKTEPEIRQKENHQSQDLTFLKQEQMQEAKKSQPRKSPASQPQQSSLLAPSMNQVLQFHQQTTENEIVFELNRTTGANWKKTSLGYLMSNLDKEKTKQIQEFLKKHKINATTKTGTNLLIKVDINVTNLRSMPSINLANLTHNTSLIYQ